MTRRCGELWPTCCQSSHLVGCGKLAVCPRRSWSQERRSVWSSWADCVPMIHARHSAVSTLVIQQLSDGNGGFHVGGLAACEQQLRREGFEAPGWRDLANRLCPGHDKRKSEPWVWHHPPSGDFSEASFDAC